LGTETVMMPVCRTEGSFTSETETPPLFGLPATP
jgi:hypothetical protein